MQQGHNTIVRTYATPNFVNKVFGIFARGLFLHRGTCYAPIETETMNWSANAIDYYVQCGPLHFGGILKNEIGIKNDFMLDTILSVGTVSNLFEHLDQKTDEFKELETEGS